MIKEVQVGQLVRSVAGRDKEKFYLIFEVFNGAFVRVVDGEKRTLTNPKRKNIKHIELFPVKAGIIAEKLHRGEVVTEEEIKETVKFLGLSYKSL